MNRLAIQVAIGCALPVSALAVDSVVLGRGIKNDFFANIECSANELCMDSLYVWEIDAKRTMAGPRVSGRVRAVISVHGLASSKYVKSVELFVLRPKVNLEASDSNGPQFSLMALSPRYKGGKYCLSMDPRSVGLEVDSVVSDEGFYCFSRKQLLRPNKSLERTRER